MSKIDDLVRQAKEVAFLRSAYIAESNHSRSCDSIGLSDLPCTCPAGQIGFRIRAEILGSPEAKRFAKQREADGWYGAEEAK